MSNPSCDSCGHLVNAPIKAKDGKEVCAACLSLHYENGLPKVPAVKSQPTKETQLLVPSDAVAAPPVILRHIQSLAVGPIDDIGSLPIDSEPEPLPEPPSFLSDKDLTTIAEDKFFSKEDETPAEKPSSKKKPAAKKKR